jgi:hypothetical protein
VRARACFFVCVVDHNGIGCFNNPCSAFKGEKL